MRPDGIAEIRWVMAESGKRVTTYEYYPFDRKQTEMGAGPSLLQRTWEKLDREVDAIKRPDTIDPEYHKTRAVALAEVLAMFMVPYFSTTQEVSAEALRRWKARQNGEEYETLGLGAHALSLPKPAVQIPRGQQTTKRAAAPKSSGNRIPAAAVNNSLQGIVTGMFTVKQIASMYKMTEGEVKSQLGIA